MGSPEAFAPAEYEVTLRDKWDWMLHPDPSDVRITPLVQEVLDRHARLENLITEKGWALERNRIQLAEMVLWEVMEGYQPRRDGHPYETHSYDVGFIDHAWGGNATDFVKALLHDTVELSRKRMLNPDHVSGGWESPPMTAARIGMLFGNEYAVSVDGLSNAKSSRNVDLDTRTHHKIYELILSDPRSIAIKIADRLHHFRTRINESDSNLIFKAHETLEVYVPLATALGLHEAARELASSALEDISTLEYGSNLHLSLSSDRYERVHEIFSQYLAQVPEGVIPEASIPRTPSLYDAYKATEGIVDHINNAYVPVYVPIVVDDNGENGKTEALHSLVWNKRVLGIALDMYTHGVLTSEAMDQVMAQAREPVSSVRVAYEVDGVPVQILFIKPNEHRERQATVFDTDSRDLAQRAVGDAKIKKLQHAYWWVSDPRNMIRTIEDANEILARGAIVAYDKGGKPIGLPLRSTLVDLLFHLDHTGPRRYTQSAQITYPDERQITVTDLSTEVMDGVRVEFFTGEKKPRQRTINPYWLEHATTPLAKREIQRYLKEVLHQEFMTQREIEEGSMAYTVRERGVAIVRQCIGELAREAGISLGSLHLPLSDVTLIDKYYKQSQFRFTKRDREYSDMMVRIGLSQPRYETDEGRTSIVWKIAREYLELHKKAAIVKIRLQNRTGAQAEAVDTITSLGLGIAADNLTTDDNAPGTGEFYVLFDGTNKQKIISMGGLRWLREAGLNVESDDNLQ
jgi:hypothetical protein